MRVFNYTAVDNALNGTSFKDAAQPNASDAFFQFNSTFFDIAGKYDFVKSKPRNYNITLFYPEVEFGSTFSITLVKILNSGFVLNWNTQINSKIAPIDGSGSQAWFGPNWDTNPNNTVNFICEQYYYADYYDDNNNDDTTEIVGDSNTYTLVLNASTAMSNNVEDDSNWADEGTPENTPISVGLQSVLAQGPDANGFYSSACTGYRLLSLNDTQLRMLKYNDSFNFVAGHKIFDQGDVAHQSMPVNFNYTIADTAVWNYSFPIINQTNASDAALSMVNDYRSIFGAADF